VPVRPPGATANRGAQTPFRTVTDGDARFDPISAVVRSWRLVLACLLLGAVLLGAAVLLRPTTYTSEAKVLWQSDVSQFLPAGTVAAGTADADRALSTQADVITGDAVMGAAAKTTGVTTKDLRTRTTIQVQQTSDVLVVQVASTTATKARAQAQALVDSYLASSKQQGTAALTAQADALQQPIDALQAQLAQLNSVVPAPGVTAAQIAAADATAAATAASRNAVIGQLSTLTTQQDQLRAAAALYPGQASVLSGADRPEEPSSPSLPVAVLLGAALGAVLGVLIALARGARRAGTGRVGG